MNARHIVFLLTNNSKKLPDATPEADAASDSFSSWNFFKVERL
jgi:hypothetical protein